MKDQHTKITGYRDLSQQEIDLMNEIKAKGNELAELIDRVKRLPIPAELSESEQGDAIIERFDWSLDAKRTLRTGIMQLVRAVALPKGF